VTRRLPNFATFASISYKPPDSIAPLNSSHSILSVIALVIGKLDTERTLVIDQFEAAPVPMTIREGSP
jgi:hypothetical protein